MKRRHHIRHLGPFTLLPALIKSVGDSSYNYAVVHRILAHAGIAARPQTLNRDSEGTEYHRALHHLQRVQTCTEKAFHIP